MDALFELVEYTGRSVFLTGKAGTGKTTFLTDFVGKTQKKFVVAAPTGIAAINAGGVTIHSLFRLPPRTFVPTEQEVDHNAVMNIHDLQQHLKYRKEQLKLFRELELLIIDEVSMLRADLMDMMDFALRKVRRSERPFGGVQLLLIGDLYQLPPVVHGQSEYILKHFYESPFFFSAWGLKPLDLVTVELTTVYRQQDPLFVDLLNSVRNSEMTEVQLRLLNGRYQPDFEPDEEGYIYLCSHNRIADKINEQKLSELGGKLKKYKAEVVGIFNESQYPNDEVLRLKVGAQVMFIRNDTAPVKKYYNGKLAMVSGIGDEEIRVRMEDSEEEVTIRRETWEQKKYFLDSEHTIQQEIMGSFEQFPLRLAWAVTIHKSQGLTFDKVMVDAGKSFTSGQVYVALSRCRSLEGIILKSRISPEVVFTDPRIAAFEDSTVVNDQIEEIVEMEKYDFSVRRVLQAVDTRWIKRAVADWAAVAQGTRALDKEKVKGLRHVLYAESDRIFEISDKFSKILQKMLQAFVRKEAEWTALEEKCRGAVNYFYREIHEKILLPLSDFYSETKGQKGLKGYNAEIKDLVENLKDFLDSLKRCRLAGAALFNATENDLKALPEGKKPTHILSYQLFEEGLSPEEIARKRGLAASTVYGHLAKIASTGILDMSRLFEPEKLAKFKEVYDEADCETLTDWKRALPDNFEFYEIRLLLNHFQYQSEKGK